MPDENKEAFRMFENISADHIKEDSEDFMPFYSTYLTPKLIEDARTQLNETDEVKEKALFEFRKLIESEKNLLTPTNDMFLLAFLRARKYRVMDAFKLLQHFWSFRKEYQDIYDNVDGEKIKASLLRNFFGLLPFRDKNGCIVGVLKAGMWNPEVDPFEVMFRAVTGVLLASVEYPATQIAGFRIIMDLRNLSWRQLKYCTPNTALLLIRSSQSCFPGRFKGIHIISGNKIFKLIWTMSYPLLTRKLKKRVYFHAEDIKLLREYIDPSVLPVEFGGEASIFDNSKWVDIIDELMPGLLELRKYGYQD